MSRRKSLLLLLFLTGCSLPAILGGGSSPVTIPSEGTGDILETTVQAAPAVIDSLARLMGSIVGGLVILSLMFSRSRGAISLMLTAIFDKIRLKLQPSSKREDTT